MNAQLRNKTSEFPPAKRRTFLAITLFTPVLFLLAVELLLRLVHYGPDLSLFIGEIIRGEQYLVMNPQVKGRYFHQVDFNPATSPDLFQTQKPPGTFRVFCLGASTTVGYPYWFNGSFSVFLRDRLKSIFPDKSIEVINLGMTATNSYAVADIARELPEYQPDCIIVYDGHNEFYGGLGVASHESLGRSRWVNRLYLRLVHYRTFLLLRNAVTAITGLFRKEEEDLPPATMMERLSRGQYVPSDAELYRQGLAVFRDNLRELRDICAGAGVPLVLSTQVSNLRRQPPFVSDSGTDTPGRKIAFNLVFNDALASHLDGDFATALLKLQGITGPETLRADLHFRIAQCLDTLSLAGEASSEYIRARDLDQLRFRASSDFNDAIRGMEDGKQLFVADVEKTFAASSPDSLIGNEFIIEHLHPNLRGYFKMAKVYASVMRTHGLLADAAAWRSADTLSETRLWEARNATRIDEMIGERKTAILTSGWPFRDQPPTVPSIPETDTLGQIVERLMRDRISWERAHLDAAAFYETHREIEEASREYRVMATMMPLSASPLVGLGELLARAGKTAEAREVFQLALGREETTRGHSGLGRIALLTGAIPEAASHFERAVALAHTPEERAESRYVLALLHLRTGDKDRAVRELKEVVKAVPSHRQAAELLSRIGGAR